MSCNPWGIDRYKFTSALALPLCLALSACGGGSSSHVASVPPPPPTPAPTPTPTPQGTIDVQTSWLDSPATRSGNYGVIGRLTLTPGNGGATINRLAAPGELQFRVSRYFDDDPTNYYLDAPAGLLPGGRTSIGVTADTDSWIFNYAGPNYRYDTPYEDYPQYFGQNLKEYDVAPSGSKTLRINYDYSRGVQTSTQQLTNSTNLNSSLLYDVGLSYVAMGEWSWRVVDLNGTAAGDFGDLLFVNGDRTPSAGIPVSGTATYDAHTLALLSSSGDAGIPFTLTADFAQRTMSTAIDQNYLYDPSTSTTEPILGIHVGGSAPFNNNGTFDIPLTGTVNYAHTPQPVTPLPEPVTGTMNGALFGPQAQQVGGVFSLERADQTLLVQDAFVGQKRGP